MNYCNNVPLNYEEVGSRDDKENWQKAITEELESLYENKTWDLVPLPAGVNPIKCKWVFSLKYDGEGKITRYKVRLVIKGCAQKQGINYNDTYAPVARLSSLRVLLSIVNKFDMHLHQLDVKNAFLNGLLREEIFLVPSAGISLKPNVVCKLNRTLYGLKQSPLV